MVSFRFTRQPQRHRFNIRLNEMTHSLDNIKIMHFNQLIGVDRPLSTASSVCRRQHSQAAMGQDVLFQCVNVMIVIPL